MQCIRLETDTIQASFITDLHLSATPPGRRTLTYMEEILDKIRFVSNLTHEHKAVGLCGGDVFHAKTPRSVANTHELTARTIHEFSQFPFGRLFGAVGNHDLQYDRIESLPHQPMGVLLEAGVYQDLSTESLIIENMDGTLRVQVDAYPYTSDDMAALDRVLHAAPREPGVDYRVVLMHQYGDPGDAPTMHGMPIIGWNRMAECDYDFALWGHDHSFEKPRTIGNCTHVRFGSLSRASLAEDEVDRQISAALLTFNKDGAGIKALPIPVKPLQIAFTAASVAVEKVHESEEVVEFFRNMDKAVAEVASDDPREVLHQLAFNVPEGEEPMTPTMREENRAAYEMALEVCGL